MLSFLSHQGKNFKHLTKIMQIDSFVLFEIRSKIVSKDNFDGFILNRYHIFVVLSLSYNLRL